MPVSWLAHIVTSSQVNFTLTGMQDSLGDSWTCTERISQANKQPGQPRSIMAIMLFQNRYSPSYNWLLSISHCCISCLKVNTHTCNLSIVTYLCISMTTHTRATPIKFSYPADFEIDRPRVTAWGGNAVSHSHDIC